MEFDAASVKPSDPNSRHGTVVDVNDQMLKMFGFERSDIIGKQIVDLVAPESREMVAEAIRTRRETDYEHRLVRKDGSSFIAEARAKVVHIGGRTLRMTALRDVTERKLSEELNRTQSRVLEMVTRGEPLSTTLDTLLRAIEAQSPDMLCSILLLDSDGVHVHHGSAPSLVAKIVNRTRRVRTGGKYSSLRRGSTGGRTPSLRSFCVVRSSSASTCLRRATRSGSAAESSGRSPCCTPAKTACTA